MKKIIQYSVSLLIAGALLWYVFSGIDLATLWQKFQQANYSWVLASGALALVAHWSRAYRWALMLEPLGYRPSVFRTTIAVLVGYLANLVFPRAGEVARCGSLNRLENIPFDKSFGAVIAERVVDVLVLLLLIVINLLLEFDRLSGFFFEFVGEKFKNPTLLVNIALAGILLLIAFYFFWKKNQEKLMQNAFVEKISGFVSGLWSGFSSVLKLKNPIYFFLHTLLIWSMYYFMTYFLCFALPETAGLSPLAILTIVVMGAVGMAAPTIGGIGSYHILVGSIVVLYGLNKQDGYTLATFLHAMQGLVFVVIFGIVAFILSAILPQKDAKVEE